jgi:hypothetical protein
MSYRSTTSRPCAVWRRVDGSPGTVAALLHSDSELLYIVACLLCVTSRPTPYCRCLAVSMSCMYLMLSIHHVWLSCMYLMCYLLRVPGVVMMSLMSSISETHRHDSKAGRPN